jgi:hypothetical protein
MAEAKIVDANSVAKVLDRALDAGAGLLRLTPTWIPRSFLYPGKRIKLHPDDFYAYGGDHGSIDERWFGSTTEAANEGRVWHEGLSFCSFEGQQFLLKDAVAEAGARVVGKALWDKYNRWPVYSSFFDNMGPIPHHMHQGFALAKLIGAVESTNSQPLSGSIPLRAVQVRNHSLPIRTRTSKRRMAVTARRSGRRRGPSQRMNH